jgi:hypothetical protein
VENEALVLDLVEWLAEGPRPYRDVMEAWRTSCPRLTIWEDTVDAKLVARCGSMVEVTERGLQLLRTRRRHTLASR